MKAKQKFNSNFLFGILVFVAAMILFISLPIVSYAETGTLGTESPEIYCTYEQNGVEVDGNELTAGTYNVSFVMSGMKSLSVIEITATYDQEQVTVESAAPTDLISDNDATFDSMGYILSDGNIVLGFVSTDDACSAINQEEQVLATVQMTFASDCDAEDYITVSENPNLTFALADYGDGYDDAYAQVKSYDGYEGNLHLMEVDVTPGSGYNVSGNLVVMTDVNGSTNGVAVYGEYTIDVYSDADRTVKVCDSVKSEQSVNENNERVNTFNIPNLKANTTYYITISSQYAISRNCVINVGDADITSKVVPIIACDFNGDAGINSIDALTVYGNASGEQSPYCDLNGDGGVNSVDALVVYACAAGSPSEEDFVIE